MLTVLKEKVKHVVSRSATNGSIRSVANTSEEGPEG